MVCTLFTEASWIALFSAGRLHCHGSITIRALNDIQRSFKSGPNQGKIGSNRFDIFLRKEEGWTGFSEGWQGCSLSHKQSLSLERGCRWGGQVGGKVESFC